MRMAPLERSDVLDGLHDDVFGVDLAPVHADVLRQDGVLRIHSITQWNLVQVILSNL